MPLIDKNPEKHFKYFSQNEALINIYFIKRHKMSGEDILWNYEKRTCRQFSREVFRQKWYRIIAKQ